MCLLFSSVLFLALSFFFFLMIRRPPRSTLSLHDALPISHRSYPRAACTGASSRARRRRRSVRFWRRLARRLRFHRLARRNLEHAIVIKPDRGQRAAPQAAGVEHQHIGREHQLERRPVSADDGDTRGSARLVREPRLESRRRELRAALFAKIHPVVRRAKAQDRKSTRLNSSHVRISYAVF